MAEFVSADIGEIEKFVADSEDAITEFERIRSKFESINTDLLGKWEGEGAGEYKHETDHILENIGGIKDCLDSITTGVLKDIKDNYNKLDADLDLFNRNPTSGE
jgi:uncharacterized protein YukE